MNADPDSFEDAGAFEHVEMEPTPSSTQIVESNSEHSITLNEEALRNILTQKEIKDRFVSIISINGVFRQGKSFLLNFLLRYLRMKYVEARDVTNWLRPEDGPLRGFNWASGSKRHTAGIHIWPEVFLTQLATGEKVAVILVDTQGSFDTESTMGDCAKIFSLSTLISSVQIYNLMRNIKQYDLTHLQCFGGYGSLFTNSDSAPFQNLCFLIRDWACPYEYAYGTAGGSALLQERLNSETPDSKQQAENIKSLFQKLTCFLMPYPGRAVDTQPTFNGDLNEIDEEFKKHVQDFADMLLAPENLVLKTVNGVKVTAEDLMCYIQEYCEVLKDDSLPKVETIYKATVEAHHKTAARKAFNLYKKNMDADVKNHPSFTPEEQLYGKHAACKVKSVDYFEDLKKFDDELVHDKYLVELKNNMDSQFKRYRAINDEMRRKHLERMEAKRAQERASQRARERAAQSSFGGSGLRTSNMTEAVGITAGVIGGAAVLAFGVAKLFAGSRGNND